MLDGLLGRGQCLRIPAQAVVKHGGRPFRRGHPESLAAKCGVLPGAVDQRPRRILTATYRGHAEGTVWSGPAARGIGYRLGFLGQRIRRGQVAGQQTREGERIER